MSPPSPPSPSPDAGHRTSGHTLRVLIVEDDPLSAFMATKMLERLGHGVQVVGTGSQAIEAVAAGDFDVVLMDARGPEVGGLDAARRLREAKRDTSRGLRLVAMTVVGDEGGTEFSRAGGFDGLLTRPFTLESLAEALRIEPLERPSESTKGESVGASTDRPALNLDRLALQLGGDAEAVTEVLRSFAQEGPRTLARLRQAFAAGDTQGIERTAHRLKGTLRWVTADAAADHAEAVENRARSGEVDLAQDPLDELVREVDRVLEVARSGG
jgi:CheY-like chemotaxis protein